MRARQRRKITVGEYVRKNALLLGILASVVGASAFPRVGVRGGPLRPEYSVRYGAVGVIFFASGLQLPAAGVARALRHYRLHAFVQAFAFVLVPACVRLAAAALDGGGVVDAWVARGLVAAACMPPPVSSAVILTRAAGGNEAAAILNAIAGCLLGVLVTPIALLLNLGVTTLVPLTATLVELAATVLGPLLVGQLVRYCVSCSCPCGGLLESLLPLVSQCALLLIIFATFCETFHAPEEGLTAANILFTVFFVLLLQIALLYVAFALANRCRGEFSAADVIAIVFCATHKSLTLGAPLLRIMFHGLSHLAQISLPLLVYHPTQIILGGMLVSHLREWAARDANAKRYKSLV